MMEVGAALKASISAAGGFGTAVIAIVIVIAASPRREASIGRAATPYLPQSGMASGILAISPSPASSPYAIIRPGHNHLAAMQRRSGHNRGLVMKIVQYPLKAGQFIDEKTKKTHVVWHGTMGRTALTPYKGKPGKATTSIDTWNDNPDRVGAPWLVDRDGTIYQCMDDGKWIYHLGLSGTNGQYDRVSVGIEFANELVLQKSGDKYYAFGKVSENTEYTGQTFRQPWRDWEYWAALEEKQIDAGIELTLDICRRHNIQPKFYKPSTTFDYPGCFNKATIICHSNCRKDKSDLILQDWIWNKLTAAGIQIVNA
jgi:hypothetical protein